MTRSYSKIYKCRTCGETRLDKFEVHLKGLCKKCRGKRKRLLNSDKIRLYYKKWYAEKGRNRAEDYQEGLLEWRQEHPDRVKAMRAIHYAVKIGTIKKASKCEECGIDDGRKLLGHHSDYTKPLQVVWVCYSCHKKIHQTPS